MFKVLSVTSHYIFSSLWQHTDSVEKGLVFWGNQPNFRIGRNKWSAAQPDHVPSIGRDVSRTEQFLNYTAGGGRISQLSVFKKVFSGWASWGRALSYCKTTLSCLLKHCARFSLIARFEWINWELKRAPVIDSLDWSSSYYTKPSSS